MDLTSGNTFVLVSSTSPSCLLNSDVSSVSDYPPGYGKLAAIEGCNPNFLIYRKFLWLLNRLLLHKQDELMQLERHLESLDQNDFVTDPRRLKSSRRDEFKPTYRKDLLKEIDGKLNEYREYLPATRWR